MLLPEHQAISARLKGSFDFRLNMEVKERPVHSGQ